MHQIRFKILIAGIGSLFLGCAPVGQTPSVSIQDESSIAPQPSNPDQPETPARPQPQPPVPVPARPSSAANLKVCPPSGAVGGLDVSDYNPGTDWVSVKNAGRGFAFIKATEGITLIDELFARDWKAAKEAGVLRGAYHFFHPHDSPTKAAAAFLTTVGALDIDDLPPVLDWEVTDGISTATQVANAKIWLQTVESATGRIPFIYTDPSFWNKLGNPQGFERYPLFVANFQVSCPVVPPPWSKWTIWQKGQGAISGVASNNVDQDVFFGTLASLVASLAMGQSLP